MLKWKDFHQREGMYLLHINAHFVPAPTGSRNGCGKVASSVRARPLRKLWCHPGLAKDIIGWREFGDTDGGDPESFIFPTRNGTAIIATNWAEDVLKPAGKTVRRP